MVWIVAQLFDENSVEFIDAAHFFHRVVHITTDTDSSVVIVSFPFFSIHVCNYQYECLLKAARKRAEKTETAKRQQILKLNIVNQDSESVCASHFFFLSIECGIIHKMF